MAGVDSRKEKRAADSRVRLRNRPAEMVMPLREVPGTTASAWATPMASGIGEIDGTTGRAACARRSRRSHIRMPTRDQHAADHEWIAPVVSACLLKTSPAMPTGIVPMASSQSSDAIVLQFLIALSGVNAEALGDDLHPVAAK